MGLRRRSQGSTGARTGRSIRTRTRFLPGYHRWSAARWARPTRTQGWVSVVRGPGLAVDRPPLARSRPPRQPGLGGPGRAACGPGSEGNRGLGHHRDRLGREAIRGQAGVAVGVAARRARLGARVPGFQRGRQDHHHPHPARAASTGLRLGQDLRLGLLVPAGRGAPARGLPPRRVRRRRDHDRWRLPGLSRRSARPGAGVGPRPGRTPRARPGQADRHPVARESPEGRSGAGVHGRSRRDRGRRADQRPGPADAARVRRCRPRGQTGWAYRAAVIAHPRRGGRVSRPGGGGAEPGAHRAHRQGGGAASRGTPSRSNDPGARATARSARGPTGRVLHVRRWPGAVAGRGRLDGGTVRTLAPFGIDKVSTDREDLEDLFAEYGTSTG